jgi:dTDP-4-amino-4,6-dideoxygalactose transaminase
MAKLAVNGGEKTITIDQEVALNNRALTDDELTEAVLDLVRSGVLFSDEGFPGETILEFEREFAKWRGVKYALAHTNGTSAIQAALFAVGVGPGDEVIVPSYTHPFSVVPILGANAIPVFCDVDPETLCADPVDIAARVTPQTKAIVPVHGNVLNEGMPCEMDEIMQIADEHDLAVVEDACLAPWATYRGVKTGAIGDAGAFSIKKFFNLGTGIDGGVFVTDNEEYYERACLLGHYERVQHWNLGGGFSLGYKFRINRLTAAMASMQIGPMDEIIEETQRNMDYLVSGLRGMRGIKVPDVPPHMDNVYWLTWHVRYEPEELDGLPMAKFIEALQAEGARVTEQRGIKGLHENGVFRERYGYGKGCPFDCPHAVRKVDYTQLDLPAVRKRENAIAIPCFGRAKKQLLDQYLDAFAKVTENAGQS